MELKRYKLGDLMEVSRGTSLAGEFYATEGELIRLTLGNFDYQRGGFKHNTSKDNIYFLGKVKEEYILNEGDIITPLTEQTAGLLGSTARIPESGKYIQSQDVALIRCNEALLDPTFCYYLLPSASVKKQLGAAAQQTKIRHTTPDRIKEVIVDIPPLAEQKAIGKILDAITSKIELNYSINHYLEAMAKQLYDYWFVQFDFPDENGRPYKSSGGRMVWNDKLKRDIPENWTNATVENIEKNIITGKTPSTDIEDNFGGPIPFVTIDDIRGSLHVYVTARTLTTKGADSQKTKYLPKGSLCCSCIGTVGVLGFIGDIAQTNQQINSIVFSKSYNKEYMYYSLQQHFRYSSAKTGNTILNMSKDEFAKIMIIYPETSILQKYHNQCEPIFSQIDENIKELNLLTKQRNELLPLLMTGQLSVRQLNNDL